MAQLPAQLTDACHQHSSSLSWQWPLPGLPELIVVELQSLPAMEQNSVNGGICSQDCPLA